MTPRLRPLFAALALALAPPALADEGAIRGVIDDQIAAFLAEDVEAAFSHAAPSIQRMFRTPANFGAMVQRGYPMVWRPDAVEYLGTTERGAAWEQDVMMTDAEGRLHLLRYRMVELDGRWRIAGVELLRGPELGA